MTLDLIGCFAFLASFVVLAATACVLFARVRSGAAACMALGLCAFVLIAVLHNLFNSVSGSWNYTKVVGIISLPLFAVGFVLFVADILQGRAPHDPQMEADAATPSEGESHGK